MTTKKRGRLTAKIDKQPSLLLPIPEYITNRVNARGGVWARHWQEVWVGMDEFDALVEKFRKRHRLTKQEAWTLLLHQEGAASHSDVEVILREAPQWKITGIRGGSAATKKRRQWEDVVDEFFMATLMRHKAARAASLILKNWPVERCPKPCDRSLRGYIGQQKKILASSFG